MNSTIKEHTAPGIDTGSRDIAVIGMSGEFPGAKNLEQFWDNLKNGKQCTTFFSAAELLQAGVPGQVINDPHYVKAGTILEDVESFDASFFGYNPREAELLDPQQRFFLEHAWLALEDAGYAPEKYGGLIGIYAGIAWNTYLLNNLAQHRGNFDAQKLFQIFINNDKDFMSTRASYKLNLKGPSMTIQTGCSTSLVAVHMACLSLLNFECDMALAGGVTIKNPQKAGYFYVEGGLGSPDGLCRTFDAKAGGTIFGSGIGLVVLKRLAEAAAERDNILAVIKSSAINNDGSAKVSYTAPGVEGQAAVILAAQELAHIDPETVDYIETHGTATSLGDPIEVTALTRVFRHKTDKVNFCALGSVKSNLGHLDAAAGIAGFIKTVLSLMHKQIPPSLHFENPNPAIDFAASPFYVNAALRDWQGRGNRRRAGVNSFGVGGTNAHVILEEAPAPLPADQAPANNLFIFSAKTGTALQAMLENFITYCREHPGADPADTAYTLAVGRTEFQYRRFIVCSGQAALAAQLAAKDTARALMNSQGREGKGSPVVFMFSGCSMQHPAMVNELYSRYACFNLQVKECLEIVQSSAGMDLTGFFAPGAPGQQASAEKTAYSAFMHLGIFIVEYSLARLLMYWGITPHALAGCGVGEYTALCLAGVLSLRDALFLVAEQGKIYEKMPRGPQLHVPLPAGEIELLLNNAANGDVVLAASNGPAHCTLCGSLQAVAEFEQQLQAEGINYRRLNTYGIYVCGQNKAAIEQFREKVNRVAGQSPGIPCLSGLTGTWIGPGNRVDADYLVEQFHKTIRLNDSLAELAKNPDWILLETGTGNALTNFAQRHPAHTEKQLVLSLAGSAPEKEKSLEHRLTTLGSLWLRGVRIDWQHFYAEEQRNRLSLPGYPFERKRYWLESVPGPQDSGQYATGKKADVADWFYTPCWKHVLQPRLEKMNAVPAGSGYLIFLDSCGMGTAIAAHLQQHQAAIIKVGKGEKFCILAADEITLNPHDKNDYQKLFQEIISRKMLLTNIIYLWSVTGENSSPLMENKQEWMADSGYAAFLYLIQAAGGTAGLGDLQLSVLGNHMQAVFPVDEVHPEKALLLGLCKSIHHEYFNLTCHSIDFLLPVSEHERDALTIKLVDGIHACGNDVSTAYRRQKQYLLTYENVKPQLDETRARLKKGGVYLLTGGLTGIGFVLAGYLAETFQARLLLLEPDLPGMTEWDSLLVSQDTPAQVKQKIKRCGSLNARGAAVSILKADITKPDALTEALAALTVQELDGVIHAAAGENAFQAIQELKPEQAGEQFALALPGTCNLYNVCARYNPAFFLLSSSLTSVTGGRGFAVFTSLAMFQDTFAGCCAKDTRFPCIAIDWDAWQRIEEEESIVSFTADLAQYAMEKAEIIEVLLYALSLDTDYRLIVSTGALSARLAKQQENQKSTLEKLQSRDPSSRLHPRPQLGTPYVAPHTQLEHDLGVVWQELFGFEKIGIKDNFFDLGGDSLLALNLVARINKQLNLELPIAKLYQGLNIEALVQIIENEQTASGSGEKEKLLERKKRLDDRKQFQESRRAGKQNIKS